jgi:hypothetical protein
MKFRIKMIIATGEWTTARNASASISRIGRVARRTKGS